MGMKILGLRNEFIVKFMTDMVNNGPSTHRKNHIVTIILQNVVIDSSFLPQLSLLQDEFVI